MAEATQDSLRCQVAIVPEELVLFHRTLAENIGYGRGDASQAEIEEATRLANAHDFIMALPEGYCTPVGEHGAKLSGGERHRMAIARAFLLMHRSWTRRPPASIPRPRRRPSKRWSG